RDAAAEGGGQLGGVVRERAYPLGRQGAGHTREGEGARRIQEGHGRVLLAARRAGEGLAANRDVAAGGEGSAGGGVDGGGGHRGLARLQPAPGDAAGGSGKVKG